MVKDLPGISPPLEENGILSPMPLVLEQGFVLTGGRHGKTNSTDFHSFVETEKLISAQ